MADKVHLKANPDIFHKLKTLSVGDIFTISTINPLQFEAEAMAYLAISSSLEIKSEIPGAYVSDIKQARKKLMEYIDRMLVYDSILYCIRLKSNNIPVGYILLNSPVSQNGLNEWSLDFWLIQNLRRKQVMVSSLERVLDHMQNMEIKGVYVMVERDNKDCRKLIEKFGFGYINTHLNSGKYILTYGIRLND